MGSPNFATNSDILVNVAIDYNDFYDEDEDTFNYDTGLIDDAELFVNSLRTWFYEVNLIDGYHSGFHITVMECVTSDGVVLDWNNYKYFQDKDGYSCTLDCCPYFASNAVNITYFTIKRAMKKELAYLTEQVETFAKDNGMGRVMGKTWTSSVNYDWSTLELRLVK